MTGFRYAVYYAPPAASRLWRMASAWLGRDAATARMLPHPALPGFNAERIAALTRAPRAYGFHATLKAPFRLAAGRDAGALEDAMRALAGGEAAFALPLLRIASIGGFVAAVPAHPYPRLNALAASCVRALDGFRAPPTAAELDRRLSAGLSAAQQAMLRQWGYPHAMAEFRFHMTLTGSLADDERETVRAALERHFAPALAEPLTVDELCLFEQPGPDMPFRIAARFPLGGRSTPPAPSS